MAPISSSQPIYSSINTINFYLYTTKNNIFNHFFSVTLSLSTYVFLHVRVCVVRLYMRVLPLFFDVWQSSSSVLSTEQLDYWFDYGENLRGNNPTFSMSRIQRTSSGFEYKAVIHLEMSSSKTIGHSLPCYVPITGECEEIHNFPT